MRKSWIRVRPLHTRRIAAAAAGLLALSQLGVLAQSVPPHPPTQSIEAPPVQPAPPPAPAAKPGLFEAIGRWFDDSATGFRDHLRGAKRRIDDLGDEAAANSRAVSDQAAKVGKGAVDAGKTAADATKSAVDAVAKMGGSRMVQGRERCVTAPNGAPDCAAAADALCRKNGYASGKSMDFTSADECPVRTMLGQSAEQCSTVTFISRAMCQ